jgi:hypothetical protein
MARYRANTRSYIGNRLIEAGEVVEYDGVPGTNLDPADDEAKVAKDAADAGRARRGGMRSVEGNRPLNPLPVEKKRELVEIPADWQDLPPEQRINLARQLGAPVKGTNTKRADETIETELARRATV